MIALVLLHRFWFIEKKKKRVFSLDTDPHTETGRCTTLHIKAVFSESFRGKGKCRLQFKHKVNVFLPVMSRCVGRSTGRFAHCALPVKPKWLFWAVVLHGSDRITGWHFNTAFLNRCDSHNMLCIILVYCDMWHIGISSSPVTLFWIIPYVFVRTFFLTYILQDMLWLQRTLLLHSCKTNMILLCVTLCTVALFGLTTVQCVTVIFHWTLFLLFLLLLP